MSNSLSRVEQFCNQVGGPKKIWVGRSAMFGWVVLDRTRDGNEPNGRGEYFHFEQIENSQDLKLKKEMWGDIKFYTHVALVPGEAETLLTGLERWYECREARQNERERLAEERERLSKARREVEYAKLEAAKYANRVTFLRSQPEWSLSRAEQIYLVSEDIKQQLELEREAIRANVVQRGISYLLHFTYPESIEKILQMGLIPRHMMELSHAGFTFSDEARYDGLREASCLSIDFPNYLMLYKYRQQRPDICILAIDVSVLWELPCLFTPGNAARHLHNHTPGHFGPFIGLVAFEKLFLDRDSHRTTYRLPEGFTTDPQAEVLVIDTIKPVAAKLNVQ